MDNNVTCQNFRSTKHVTSYIDAARRTIDTWGFCEDVKSNFSEDNINTEKKPAVWITHKNRNTIYTNVFKY